MADPEMAERLARIEALLSQVLHELRTRRRSVSKKTRTVAARASAAAMDLYKPTEMEIAAARRALRRKR